MYTQGDEAKLDISLHAADMELTKEDANMLVSDTSDKELAPQLCN